MTHLSPDQISAFLDGKASLAEALEARAHVDACESCLEWVASAVRSARAPEPLQIGRYRVKALLGAGAMGKVYDAFDPDLERWVAIKRLKHAPTPEHRLRLQREAQSTARLRHPHVVMVHDFGEDAEGMYFVMQRVEGVTLSAWLRLRDRTWQEILAVFVLAGEGLAAAHGAGLVHRDFKPQNVLVTPADSPVVTDFGLAQMDTDPGMPEGTRAEGSPSWDTQSGSMLGTPAYMAPEQHRREGATAASDQFSFCVSLFEALTGERPFSAGTPETLLARMRERPPSPARGRGSRTLPSRLERVLGRGLAFVPEQRFEDMDALVRALRQILGFRARTLRWGSAAVTIAAVAAGGYLLASARMSSCTALPSMLTTLWQTSSRGQVERAFKATAKLSAARTFEVVDAAFLSYLAGDAQQRVDACTAHAGDEVLGRRLGCLARHAGQAQALRDVLASAGEGVVVKSGSAVESLLNLDECSSSALLLAAAGAGQGSRNRVLQAHLEPMLAKTRAAFGAGLLDQSAQYGAELVKQATSLGDDPLHAEALLLVGETQLEQRHLVEALETLHQAALVAEGAGADGLRAEALLSQVRALGGLGRLEEISPRLEETAAILRRVPGTPRLQSRLLATRMLALNWSGHISESVLVGRELVVFEDRRGSTAPLAAASAHANLGAVLMTANRFDESRDEFLKSLQGFERAYGEHSSMVAKLYASLAELELRRLRPDVASPLGEKAVALIEESYGRGNPLLEGAFYTLATARALLGRPPEEVLPLFEKSRAAGAAVAGPSPNTVSILLSEARYHADRSEWREGKRLYEQACETARVFPASSAPLASCLLEYAESALNVSEVELAHRLLVRVDPKGFEDGGSSAFELRLQSARLKTHSGQAKAGRGELAALLAEYEGKSDFSSSDRAYLELALAEAWAATPSDSARARPWAMSAQGHFAEHGMRFRREDAAKLLRRMSSRGPVRPPQ